MIRPTRVYTKTSKFTNHKTVSTRNIPPVLPEAVQKTVKRVRKQWNYIQRHNYYISHKNYPFNVFNWNRIAPTGAWR